MAIQRKPVQPDKQFTIVSNEWARDERISLKARGLLTLILSHRIGWNVTIESLARTNPEGKAAIRTAVNELEECGYLKRKRMQDEAGVFTGFDYILSDPPSCDFRTPSFENRTEVFDFPTTDNPTTDNPTTDNRTHKKTIPQNTINEEDHPVEVPAPAVRKGAGYSDAFLEWWSHYPLKKDKGAAYKAWKKITDTSKDVLIAGADRYANDPNRVQGFTKYPASWLNARAWEDEDGLPARESRSFRPSNEQRMAAGMDAVRQAQIGQADLGILEM